MTVASGPHRVSWFGDAGKNQNMPQAKYSFLNELDLEKEVIIKVSRLLDGVVRGSSNVLTSPLGKNLDPELILFAWDGIFNSHAKSLTDELITLENLNRSKYEPRSLAADWTTRRDSVLSYFSSDDSKNVPDLIGGPRRLRPISVTNALGYLKNSTNSGLPFYRRKGDVKDILKCEFASLLARRDDCVMFTRTQEGGKTRTVWGYPCADTLNEMRFYRPLLQYQRKLDYRSALLGPEAVDTSITRLIDRAIDQGEKLLSIDFSSYDASVKTRLQEVSFDYIRSLFIYQTHDDLGYIEERFNNIGLITPDGVFGGPHGVPSGSTFTNEVDSIAQCQCAINLGMDTSQFNIQGDDGVYCLMDPGILKTGFQDYGLSVNDEKSYISDTSVIYLQNLHSADYRDGDGICRGIYPTYRALSRIIYPERFDKFSADSIEGADYYSIKTISILENCRNHPLFTQLVKFVAKLDKYQLSYTQQGLQKYIQRIKKSSGVEGILRHHPGDGLTGLNSFKTVKILSEL
jgi:hypothetical protein